MTSQTLLTFREIDNLHGVAKGTAFRAFKRLGAQLVEGRDYQYWHAATHGADIEALRRTGRIYASTVNAVLLTPAGYARLQQALTGAAP